MTSDAKRRPPYVPAVLRDDVLYPEMLYCEALPENLREHLSSANGMLDWERVALVKRTWLEGFIEWQAAGLKAAKECGRCPDETYRELQSRLIATYQCVTHERLIYESLKTYPTLSKGATSYVNIEDAGLLYEVKDFLDNIQVNNASLKSASQNTNGEFNSVSSQQEVLANVCINNQSIRTLEYAFLNNHTGTQSVLENTPFWVTIETEEKQTREIWFGSDFEASNVPIPGTLSARGAAILSQAEAEGMTLEDMIPELNFKACGRAMISFDVLEPK